jgi:hypothetical protein
LAKVLALTEFQIRKRCYRRSLRLGALAVATSMSKRPSRPAAVAAVHKLTAEASEYNPSGFRGVAPYAAAVAAPPVTAAAAGAVGGGEGGAADDSTDQTSDDSETEDGDDDEADDADGDNKQARASGVIAGGVGAPVVFKKEKTKWTTEEVGFALLPLLFNFTASLPFQLFLFLAHRTFTSLLSQPHRTTLSNAPWQRTMRETGKRLRLTSTASRRCSASTAGTRC